MTRNPQLSNRQQKVVSWLLRSGISFTFFYAALSGFLSPSLWVGYIPDLPLGVESSVLLQLWGVTEVILALWLLSGWRIYLPAIGLALATILLMVFNLSQFSILFRDVAIVFSCAALVVMHYPHNTKSVD